MLETLKKDSKFTKELNNDQIETLTRELEANSNMVIMIFKFFLQSYEFDFFVRRLKNVASTRAAQTAPRENQLSDISVISNNVSVENKRTLIDINPLDAAYQRKFVEPQNQATKENNFTPKKENYTPFELLPSKTNASATNTF